MIIYLWLAGLGSSRRLSCFYLIPTAVFLCLFVSFGCPSISMWWVYVCWCVLVEVSSPFGRLLPCSAPCLTPPARPACAYFSVSVCPSVAQLNQAQTSKLACCIFCHSLPFFLTFSQFHSLHCHHSFIAQSKQASRLSLTLSPTHSETDRMHIRPSLLLLGLVLLSVSAQLIPPLNPEGDPSSTGGGATTPASTTSPAASTTAATTTAVTTTAVVTSPPLTPTNTPTTPPTNTPATSTERSSRTGTNPNTRTSTLTNTVTSSGTSSAIAPTNTSDKKDSSGGTGGLATAAAVVGSIVVAAAIGIWVFRKWKLSPSRNFQSKIRGDDYQDYPRSYESDTVFLRNLGDQPTVPEPASKSPYSAGASLPAEDQYYDANYANDQHAGYGHDGYNHGHNNGYDQTYDHGGYDNGYNHGEYAQSQVGGGYAASQVGGGYAASQVGGGYAASQVGGGYNNGGYAQSNVGGGYQHGYDDYGRR